MDKDRYRFGEKVSLPGRGKGTISAIFPKDVNGERVLFYQIKFTDGTILEISAADAENEGLKAEELPHPRTPPVRVPQPYISAHTRKASYKSSAYPQSADRRYWLMSPGEKARLWDECYEKGVIEIGDDLENLGDLRAYVDESDIGDKIEENRGESKPRRARMLWLFMHEMSIGDIIFAKGHRSEIIGRGIIESDYEYHNDNKYHWRHIHHVKWTYRGSRQVDKMLPIQALTELNDDTSDTLRKILDVVPAE